MSRHAKWALGALLVSLAIAGVLSPYASPSPDGLETVARPAGFADRFEAAPPLSAPMPDYSVAERLSPVLSTGIAGVVGTLVCALSIVIVGRRMSAGRARSGADDGR